MEDPIPPDQQEFKSLKAYNLSIPKLVLAAILIVGTAGVFGLCLLWSLRLRALFRGRCNAGEATMFVIGMTFDPSSTDQLLVNQHDHTSEIYVKHDDHGQKYFEFQCIRFVYDGTSKFVPSPDSTVGWTYSDILSKPGLTGNYFNDATITFSEGKNLIDVPMKPLWLDCMSPPPSRSNNLLGVEEFLGPIYVYQYLCCALWFAHEYEVFSAILICCIWLSGALDIYTRRQNMLRIKKLAAFKGE